LHPGVPSFVVHKPFQAPKEARSGTINEKRASSNGTRVMKRSVESLPQGDRPMVWYDERLAGFGVRAMPSGRRDYFARYR
jgi:hypothetical protein